jgi:hypothetical protein
MCNPNLGRVGLGIATTGLSEAIRPALSKKWQGNIDQAGALGLGGPILTSMLSPNRPNLPGTNMVAASQQPRAIR